VAAKTVELGLDKPFIVRYLIYMGNVLRGDFGVSWFQGYSVMQEFVNRMPYTFALASMAMAIAVVIGIPIGIVAAVRHNKPTDYVVTFASLFFASAPSFWLAMMMQTLFALKLGWLPPSGVGTLGHYVMPAFSLAASLMASQARISRTWLLNTIRADYVRTARAKGASEFRVIVKHALRNALLPIITGLGMTFAIILGGSVVIERVYAFPGIGSYLIGAVKSTDVPVVMGCIIVLALVVGIVNLIVDILYAVIDPRVKYGST
jgi:peptide/nickel transport system permease protein